MAYTFREARLANGLTVVGEIEPSALTAAVGFFVRAGTRDEPLPLMGVSHFLEHMMFKGGASTTAEELNRAFDRIGSRTNAYTSSELTCFHTAVLPEFVPEAIDLLAGMMRPALRQSDFDSEKGVILEEIAMYKDNPFWVLYERAMEEHYPAHPLGYRVLGTNESISALRAEQMRAYFDDRYGSRSTVVALSGSIDFDRAARQLDDRCGSWGPGRGPAPRARRPALAPRSFEMRDPKVNRGYAVLLAEAPAMDDERRYAASLLAAILGGPDNSRLHWSLVETGLADTAEAGYDPRDGTGDYMVYLSCEPERLDEVLAIASEQVAALRDSLEEADLDRIRARVATGVTLAGERPDGRMQRLGRQWTYLGRHATLEQELERLRAVSVADLRGLLAEFPMRPCTRGVLRPDAA
ncbi:MAG: insulinase family protein [Phycisphaerae bacterium]|nr:insulinase family protein [Phycisphaerae bacterium]